jgi:hypothetical protein
MTIEGLFTNVATLLQAVAPAAAIVVALAAGIYFAHGSLTDNPGSIRKAKGGAIGAAALYGLSQVVSLIQHTGGRLLG